MKTQIKSIFNLIEIFRKAKRSDERLIDMETHCGQKYHHDFYCDAEEPYKTI